MPPKKEKPPSGKKKSSKKSVNTDGVIKLSTVLDISHSKEFFDQVTVLTKGKSKIVVLDAGDVERVTTPCVQIILSLGKTLEKDNRLLKIDRATDDMRQVFCDLGLEEQFNKWSEC
jgi:anti-anti-sigma regulatory factor